MMQKHLLLLIFVTTIFVLAIAKCPPGSVIRNEKCYKFHLELSPYGTANLSCSILKGHPAIPRNQEENDFLEQESKRHFGKINSSDAWIGARFPQNGSYSNYEGGYADASADLYCIAMKINSGFWGVNVCRNDIRKPYICEYEVPVNTVAPPTLTNLTILDYTTKPILIATVLPYITKDPSAAATTKPITNLCPAGWLHFNGSCYQSTAPAKFSWKNAESYCISQKAHLVSIHNDDEFKFVDR
uniref:C-type lectin domain-containing protein n=1 Tax=Panagrolaimus sp. ES5 TaxID=591445 RepID=A0AC34GD46_9BILA